MTSGNMGYLLTCRKDIREELGLLESYKLFYKGDMLIVDLVCCIGADGKPIVPAYMDISSGFSPLYKYPKEGEDFDEVIRKFVKGNKPIFGKIGTFTMIGVFTLKFDRNTLVLNEEKSSFKFYVPNAIVNKMCDAVGNPPASEADFPAVACDEVSDRDYLHTYQVSKDLINGYRAKCIEFLTGEVCQSRESYILARAKSKK